MSYETSSRPRLFNLVLLLIFLLGLALRTPWLFRGLWYDEAFSLIFFIDRGPEAILSEQKFALTNHAGYSWCAWMARSLLGKEDWVLRLPAYLAGAAAILAAGFWFRHRLGTTSAILYTFFLAAAPLAVNHSVDGRGYAFILFFTLALIHVSLSYIESGKNRHLYLMGVATTIGACTQQQFYLPLLSAAAAGCFSLLNTAPEKSLPRLTSWRKTKFLLPFLFSLLLSVFLLSLRFPLTFTLKNILIGKPVFDLYIAGYLASDLFGWTWIKEFILCLGWQSSWLGLLFTLGVIIFLATSYRSHRFIWLFTIFSLALPFIIGVVTGRGDTTWRHYLYVVIPWYLASAAGLLRLGEYLGRWVSLAALKWSSLALLLLSAWHYGSHCYPPYRLGYLADYYIEVGEAVKILRRSASPGAVLLHCTHLDWVNDTQTIWKYYLGAEFDHRGLASLLKRQGETQLWYVSERPISRLEEDPKYYWLPDKVRWKKISALRGQTIFRGELHITGKERRRYRARLTALLSFEKANLAMRRRRFPEAEQAYLVALRLLERYQVPFPVERIYNNLAAAAFCTRRPQEGANRLNLALSINPAYEKARYNLHTFRSRWRKAGVLAINVVNPEGFSPLTAQELINRPQAQKFLARLPAGAKLEELILNWKISGFFEW